MKKRITSTVALAAAILSIAGGSVLAVEGVPKDPNAEVQITGSKEIPLEHHVTGVLEFRDVEGGYYAVGEWALMGDTELFKANVGQQVILYGKPFDGMTTMVAKAFVVNELVAAKAPPEGGFGDEEPVVAGEKLTLNGVVEHKDLEGGFYAVDGIALVGDQKLIASLVGQRVVVHGTRDLSPSIFMVERVAVESIAKELTAGRAKPSQVAVAGKPVTFDQAPVVADGALMVPLRFVVEAAGGSVEWDAKERMVRVEMSDRQAWFWVGESKAEMTMNNVRYFTRNLLPMAKAPMIQNGRVLISADALSNILGLFEATTGAEGELNLSVVSQ